MTAVAQKHEENAIKVAEVASELSKPPNLQPTSSTDQSKSNGLASALFMRKGKDNKKKSKSKSQQKKESLVHKVEQVKESEQAALSRPETAEQVTEDDSQDDPVLDLAEQLLDQLDTDEPANDHKEPSPERDESTSSSISKVPSTVSSGTSPSAASAESVSTAKSSSTTNKISNFFSKKSRQQARLDRRQAEMDAQRDAAAKEAEANKMANGGMDGVEWERKSMLSICRSLNVEMVEMNPDGHCLFAAVAHQLNLQPSRYMKAMKQPDAKETFQSVRTAVAKQMREHPDDFIAFIPSEEGLMTTEQFEKYCDNIENTAEWGGQPEILAVSNAFEVPVIVYQAGSPPLKIGDQWIKKLPLRISYHRRMYGLGEHYNSLRRKPEQIAMPVPMG